MRRRTYIWWRTWIKSPKQDSDQFDCGDGIPAGLSSFRIISALGLAATPGLLICAVLGLWLSWRALAARQWIIPFAYLFLISASAAFTSLPKGDPGAWALSHYNMGVRTLAIAEQARAGRETELAAHEFARSQRELERAFAYAPASTEINLALGNLWLANGDRPRARLFYGRVLSIDPAHPSALNNLGVLALEEERWTLASQFFTDALKIDSTSAKSYYLLAKAQFGSEDRHAALIAIEKALALRPGQKEFLLLRQELTDRQP